MSLEDTHIQTWALLDPSFTRCVCVCVYCIEIQFFVTFVVVRDDVSRLISSSIWSRTFGT